MIGIFCDYSCDIYFQFIYFNTYWNWNRSDKFLLHKKHGLIPQKFTNDFIIESLKFVLKNNNVLFDNHMFLQLEEQGHKMCSPVCLFNCRLFRRDKTFYQRTTKIIQWKWVQVNYGAVKTLYGWWCYLLAIKVKL